MKGLIKKIATGIFCSAIPLGSLSCGSKADNEIKNVRSVVETSLNNGKEYRRVYNFEVEGKPILLTFYEEGPYPYWGHAREFPSFAFKTENLQIQVSGYADSISIYRVDSNESGINKIYGWSNCHYEEPVGNISDHEVLKLGEDLTYKVIEVIKKENLEIERKMISQAKQGLTLK